MIVQVVLFLQNSSAKPARDVVYKAWQSLAVQKALFTNGAADAPWFWNVFYKAWQSKRFCLQAELMLHGSLCGSRAGICPHWLFEKEKAQNWRHALRGKHNGLSFKCDPVEFDSLLESSYILYIWTVVSLGDSLDLLQKQRDEKLAD